MSDDKDQNVLLMYYRLLRDDQELYINQQWKVINYSILLYAAVFAIYLNLNGFKIVLIMVGLLICIISCLLIYFGQDALNEDRKALDKIEEMEDFKIVTSIKSKSSLLKSKYIYWILMFINVFSYAILVFAICSYQTCTK